MIEIALTIPTWIAIGMYWAFIIACGCIAWWFFGSAAFALWLWASEYSVHKQMKKNKANSSS